MPIVCGINNSMCNLHFHFKGSWKGYTIYYNVACIEAYEQHNTRCIPLMGFGEGGLYAVLLLSCESREVVSDRFSSQVKHIKKSQVCKANTYFGLFG